MGERVLVTGGEGDLAREVTSAFRTAGDFVEAPGRASLDVADPGSIDGFFAARAPFDLLIANAGRVEDALLARTDEARWERLVEINLHGAFRCARAAAGSMVRRRRGHLVFISSQAALHPGHGQAAYAAAKAGLLGLARSLARELGPAGVRVNTILPGFLETRISAAVPAEIRARILASHALERFNTADRVARFLVHLHHDLTHTSGQVFQLDSRVSTGLSD